MTPAKSWEPVRWRLHDLLPFAKIGGSAITANNVYHGVDEEDLPWYNGEKGEHGAKPVSQSGDDGGVEKGYVSWTW